VLLGSALMGYSRSAIWLVLLAAGAGFVILLQRPFLGFWALIFGALAVPLNISTGTEVALNLATLLVPLLLVLWILDMVRRREVRLVPSRTTKPLMLFLGAGLVSLAIGTALWDPLVPRPDHFVVVQLAQWGIFAFSGAAFLLMANLGDQKMLRRIVFFYLVIAGSLALVRVWPPTAGYIYLHLDVLDRAPFWMMLTALAGGQLIFNRELSIGWRVWLVVCLGAALVYSFVWERVTASNWVGVVAVLAVLGWLRYPRLRWPVVVLLVVLVSSGLLTSAVYNFSGGDEEWEESGGSRLALIGRVVEVTMRNPITGLGPAAYRPYAKMKPLVYEGAFYIHPWVSSHNNYVDLFSHVGVLGLGLLGWFVVEVTLLGRRLRDRLKDGLLPAAGFVDGYINGVLAAGAGALALMLFADWILPFVYNIGLHGFQVSVLVWFFMGGLVTLEKISSGEGERTE
jgi:uncharacterized membrane protein YhaH (DUF805 family)